MTLTAVALALGIGSFMGLMGAGGSILAVPALTFLLHLPAKDAVSVSLLVVGTCAAVGAAGCFLRGTLPLKTAVIMGAASTAGALFGSAIGARLSDHLQLSILGVVMVAAAIFMLRMPAVPRVPLIALGVGIGMLTGIVGVGGGFLLVPALAIGAGLPMQQAAAVSLFVITLSALAALPNYVGHLTVAWSFIVPFTIVAAAATMAGGTVAQRIPARRLRQVFGVTLLVIAAYVLAQA